MLKVRYKPIMRQFLVDPSSFLSPQGRSQAIADIAAKYIAEIDRDNTAALNGAHLEHETTVDGRLTTNLASIKPSGGIIIATWGIETEIVRETLDLLRKTVRVKSGRFRDSQRLYADGVEVDTPEECWGASQVVIASTLPYARKIEGGFKRPGNQWADNKAGVYHATAAMMSARFGNSAKIRFGTRQIVLGETPLTIWARAHATRKFGYDRQGRRQQDKDERQPAVIITFKSDPI